MAEGEGEAPVFASASWETMSYALEFTAGVTFDQFAQNMEKLCAVLRALRVNVLPDLHEHPQLRELFGVA